MYVLNKRHCIKFTIFRIPIFKRSSSHSQSISRYPTFDYHFLPLHLFFFQTNVKMFPFLGCIFFSSLEGKKNNDLISLHPPLALLARETFASKRNESPVYMCTSTRETCVYTYTYIWEYISYTYYIYIYIYIYVCIGECIKK